MAPILGDYSPPSLESSGAAVFALTGLPSRSLQSRRRLVGLGRFELPTSRLSSARSNQLSYRPDHGADAKWASEAPRFNSVYPCEERETKTAASRVLFQSTRTTRFWHRYLMRSLKRTSRSQALTKFILRKEVIQPQVPLRLPCYDFTPVADLTVAGCLLAVSAPF